MATARRPSGVSASIHWQHVVFWLRADWNRVRPALPRSILGLRAPLTFPSTR